MIMPAKEEKRYTLTPSAGVRASIVCRAPNAYPVGKGLQAVPVADL
jgi:hypothetical protein